jgi:tRNA (guanine37-N1)-methyltransferase
MTLELGVITIFPEMFDCLKYGVVGKAFEKNLARLQIWNLRKWAVSAYGHVDDRAYGGGRCMNHCIRQFNMQKK